MLGGKQQGLGSEVVLHVAVVVQVVVLQVREGGDVEDDAVDAVQGQGVRRQLDNTGTAAVLLGRGQEAGDDGSLGGRAHGLERDWPDVGFDSAAQGSLGETRGDGRAHQVRGRRLAIRARHGHGRQARGRGRVDVVTQGGDDASRISHLNDRHAQASFTGLLAAGLIRENHGGTGFDGRVGEADAVLGQAGDRHEYPAGFAVIGGNGHARDRQVGGVERRGGTVRAVEPLDLEACQGTHERDRIDGRTDINH